MGVEAQFVVDPDSEIFFTSGVVQFYTVEVVVVWLGVVTIAEV